jgi:predicted esterase YcpF (UPF0227 family)
MTSTLLVYLHGFRSSPNSAKAVMTGEAVRAISTAQNSYEWYCPQLLASPKKSMDMVSKHIDQSQVDRMVIIGSSLGGFYTNYLAEKYRCKGIVLNPAVYAARELEPHVGMMTAYDSEEPFDFKAEYIDQLQVLQVNRISNPERYFLIAAKGDELLDWREMAAFYPGAKQLILEGSDHGIADYATHLSSVIEFIEH